MTQPKILAFAGSTRTGSFNKLLIRAAIQGAEKAGAKVTYLDLRELPLPLFDQDLEEKGFPENARKLKELMIQHDGFLISAPEYNSSVTGVLKNAIDWASRSMEPDEPSLVCFKGKAAALMSASPGALGGLRGLVTLRSILGNIGVFLLPDQVSIPKADEAFQPDGSLKDAKKQASVEKLGKSLTEFLRKLHS